MVKSSVWTLSAPAALNASTPQAIAFRIAGVPGTRPPIWSVRRSRFDSSAEGFKASSMTRVALSCVTAAVINRRETSATETVLCITAELEMKLGKNGSWSFVAGSLEKPQLYAAGRHPVSMAIPKEIRGQKYISLATFRRDGTAVYTPVWF